RPGAAEAANSKDETAIAPPRRIASPLANRMHEASRKLRCRAQLMQAWSLAPVVIFQSLCRSGRIGRAHWPGALAARMGAERPYHPGPEALDTIPPRGGAGIAPQPMRPPGEPMFTRKSTAEPKKLEPIKSNAGPNLSAPQALQPQRRPSAAEVGAKSVIGNDLKIIGQGLKIISQGTLQVDGDIEGDVGGSEVIIGEKGKVTGTV